MNHFFSELARRVLLREFPVGNEEDIDLELLRWVLREIGDPDAEILGTYLEGVPLGIDQPLPRTPAVFPRKTKWKLKHDFKSEGQHLNDNYKSGKELKQVLEEEFVKQEKRGMMMRMPLAEAQRKWGDKLYIASLAVI